MKNMLFGFKPLVGDLCEVSPLAYKEVQCEVLESNYETNQYKLLFNSANKQEVFWIDSNRINWIARKYKIINATEIENDSRDKTALIIEAIAYDITYMETENEVNRFDTFSDDSELLEVFILNANSKIANYVLHQPEKQKILNLTHFRKSKVMLKSGLTDAYMHEDY